MSEETNKKTDAPEEAPEEAIDGDAAETEVAAEDDAEVPEPESPEPSEPEPSGEIDREAELEVEAADLRDKLLRALAETENVRRRAVRDREDAFKYAIANFAREMVAVADNLGRALDSVPADLRAENEAVENLVVGVEMTEKTMIDAFGRCGIQPIEALDQRFDHNFHEALYELEDKETPAGTVIQVIETGYLLHGRLLRPAKVGVSKGGPRAASEPEAPESKASEEAQPESAAKASTDAYEKPAETGAQLDEKL
jgi:molecular chaperone GrpE